MATNPQRHLAPKLIALFVGAVSLLGFTNMSWAQESCYGEMTLDLLPELSMMSTQEVLEVESMDLGEVDEEDESPLYGMSCDGYYSCSVKLLAALGQTKPLKKVDPRKLMCLPGEPDCTLEPATPNGSSNVDFSFSLIPYLCTDTKPVLRPVVREVQDHPALSPHFSREIPHAIDHPPRPTV